MGSCDAFAHPKHVSEVSIWSVPSTKSPDGDLDQGLVGDICDDLDIYYPYQLWRDQILYIYWSGAARISKLVETS